MAQLESLELLASNPLKFMTDISLYVYVIHLAFKWHLL